MYITFIFDRCRTNSVALTPVKYYGDANNLKFWKIENYAYRAINERSFSDLHARFMFHISHYNVIFRSMLYPKALQRLSTIFVGYRQGKTDEDVAL